MSKQQARMMGFALIMSFAALRAMAGEAPNSTLPKPQEVDGTSRPHVGLLAGYAEQNGPGKAAFAYGVDAGFQPLVPFGLGIQFTRFRSSFDAPAGVDAHLDRNALLLKGSYNFGGENVILRATYLGLKVGAVFDKSEVTGGGLTFSESRTRFAFAPELGMDFMLCPQWSVGAEFSYLFTVGPEKNYNTAEALASVKYWF